jgi:putative pyruvate formate lyase activating enzyme
MHRQVGDLVLDADGLARRGLLVRHLVLPGGLAGSFPGWIC